MADWIATVISQRVGDVTKPDEVGRLFLTVKYDHPNDGRSVTKIHPMSRPDLWMNVVKDHVENLNNIDAMAAAIPTGTVDLSVLQPKPPAEPTPEQLALAAAEKAFVEAQRLAAVKALNDPVTLARYNDMIAAQDAAALKA
jgi:hypothetical protein